MAILNEVYKFFTGHDRKRIANLKKRMEAAQRVSSQAEDRENDSIMTNTMAFNNYDSCSRKQKDVVKACRAKITDKLAKLS